MTGTPILTSWFSNLSLVVEAAFGAAPGDNGPWTDLTPYLKSPAVSATIGSADQTSRTQPAVFGCVLDNTSKLFSKGPQGISAGLDRIPIRERVIWNGTSYTRFWGEAKGFTPRWDPIGKSPIALLTANGALLRITGTATQPPIASAMRHFVSSQDHLVSYWPMEEGTSATSFAAATAGTLTMTSSTGLPKPGSFTGFDASAGAPTLGAETYFAPVDTTSDMSSGGQIWFLINVPGGTIADGTRIASINTALTPGLTRIDLIYNTVNSGSFGFKGYNGSTLVTTGAPAPPPGGANGQDVLLGFNWVPVVGAIDLDLEVCGLNVGGSSSTGDAPAVSLIARIASITIAPDANCSGVSIGHLYVQNVALGTSFTVPDAASAFNGETVTDRIARLATEQGETVTITGTSTVKMGPQPIKSFIDILRECELTDLGVLSDGAAAGLQYTARDSREDQAVTLTLDAAAGDIVDMPAEDDDLGLLNTFQATRTNGGTYTYSDTDPTSTLSVPNIAEHPDSAEINCQADDYLPHYAGFRVNLGEVPGYRYPNLALSIHSAPRILAGWLATKLSSRLTVKNLDDVRSGDDPRDRDIMVLGWTESIDKFSWIIGVNAASYDPWHIAQFAADTGDAGEFVMRLSPDSSSTVGDTAAGAGSLTVSTPSGPLWPTGSGDDFPVDLDVGGLRVHCTGISGATTPQTFTVSPTALRIPTGAPVDVWVSPRLSL